MSHTTKPFVFGSILALFVLTAGAMPHATFGRQSQPERRPSQSTQSPNGVKGRAGCRTCPDPDDTGPTPPVFSVGRVYRESSKPGMYLLKAGGKLLIPNSTVLRNLGLTEEGVLVVADGALARFPDLPALNGPTLDALNIPLDGGVKPSDVFFGTIIPPLFRSGPADWQYHFWDTQKDPASIVARNAYVAGWVYAMHISGHGNDCDSLYDEDYHYTLILDPEFIRQMYGPEGLLSSLNKAVLPGDPAAGAARLPFADQTETGVSRGVTLNSFTLPGNIPDVANPSPGFNKPHLTVEVNAWHVYTTLHRFHRNWWGRGPAPDKWVRHEYMTCGPYAAEAQSWWPYLPDNPDGGGALQEGQYVVMRGTLWQDKVHEDPAPEMAAWDQGATKGQAGWLEMHPPDAIIRSKPSPSCTDPIGNCQKYTTSLLEFIKLPNGFFQETKTFFLAPDTPRTPGSSQVLKFQELIDGRYTDMSTVLGHDARISGDQLMVKLTIANQKGRQGRFKATYLLWWE